MHVFARPRIPRRPVLPGPSTRKEHLSFIIRSAAKGVNGLLFGASFTYHFPTRTMYAFIHCYKAPSYIDLPSSLMSFFDRPNSSATPFLVPLFLLHVDMEQRYQFITEAHLTLFRLEIQAGIRESRRDTDEEIDFDALSKDISYFIGNLSLVTWACGTMKRQLGFMGEVMERYEAHARENRVSGEEVESVREVVGETLESLGCLDGSIEEQAECLSERAQALIQTVYSGIAQRDAALSQNAAMAAARDSAIMRVIAAITMFFLPATTVATFFSTSFFDFQVSRNEPVYSWWLWLYWLVTVLLTVIIMAATFLWWRKKERELSKGIPVRKRGLGEWVRRFAGLRRNMIVPTSEDEN